MAINIIWQSLCLKAVFVLMEARAYNNLLCYYTETDISTKVRGRR